MKQFSPEVVWVPLDKVIPYPLNNKKHPKSQVDAIAGAILEYGWDVPIVLDEDGMILKGHGRYLAAQKLGMAEVPVIRRTDLTSAQKKACRISDNRIAVSDWDFDALKVELESLKEVNFDLEMTGFSLEECDSIFNLGVIDFQGKQIFGEDGVRQEVVTGGQPLGQQPVLEPNERSPEPPEPGEKELVKSDGSLLELVEVTIAEPRHQVQKGEVWQLGQHILVIAEVLTEWQCWVKYLEGNAIFAPYAGPFIPLTIKAEESRLVMVQPDQYIAGHILDQYENQKGAGSVRRA